MNISGATVLVTGANRGLGLHLARQSLERGAARVYATARRPESIPVDGVERLRLDITDPAGVAEVAAIATDVNVLINNAGVSTRVDLVTGDLEAIRLEMDTHFYGTLALTRAFAATLGRNGGGAIVNVMSALSFLAYQGANAYSAAKAAEWALTNATRLELAAQGTQVLGAHLGSTDTDMMAGFDVPKADPAVAVGLILDALESGAQEILTDEPTRAIKALLSRPPEEIYPATG